MFIADRIEKYSVWDKVNTINWERTINSIERWFVLWILYEMKEDWKLYRNEDILNKITMKEKNYYKLSLKEKIEIIMDNIFLFWFTIIIYNFINYYFFCWNIYDVKTMLSILLITIGLLIYDHIFWNKLAKLMDKYLLTK